MCPEQAIASDAALYGQLMAIGRQTQHTSAENRSAAIPGGASSKDG
jgi:hypothetical protein